MNIVLDSDVVISALISTKRAGNFILRKILNNEKQVKIITTTQQIKEIEKVLKSPQFVWRQDLKLWQKFKLKTQKVKLNQKLSKQALGFVNDTADCHILTSCLVGKTNFLLTYNLKDYKIKKIKNKFNLKVVNPGYFIQFLRTKEIR